MRSWTFPLKTYYCGGHVTLSRPVLSELPDQSKVLKASVTKVSQRLASANRLHFPAVGETHIHFINEHAVTYIVHFTARLTTNLLAFSINFCCSLSLIRSAALTRYKHILHIRHMHEDHINPTALITVAVTALPCFQAGTGIRTQMQDTEAEQL